MPLELSRYVSPVEMAREAMKLTEVLAKVLVKENNPKICQGCPMINMECLKCDKVGLKYS